MPSALTTWLRGLTTDQLVRVLVARPDVVSAQEPRDVEQLVQRLEHPSSIQLALQRIPLPCLQLTEALQVVGPRPTRERLSELLGDTGLDDALLVLAEHALVWPDEAGVLHAATSLSAFWPSPLGAGPPLRESLAWRSSDDLRHVLAAIGVEPGKSKDDRLAALLAHHGDPVRVRALVATGAPDVRELLKSFANRRAPTDPVFYGSSNEQVARNLQWASDRALLVSDEHGYDPPEMPAEVTRALRGPDWRAPFTCTPPEADLVEVDRQQVDNAAAAAASGFVAVATAVLAECSKQPFPVVRSGGIGPRELTRIGKVVQADERSVRLALETALEAGLLYTTHEHAATGQGYLEWSSQEPAARLTALQNAWWNLGRTPTESRGPDGKTKPALGTAPSCTNCVQTRRGLVSAAAGLPAGHALKVPAELGTLTSWYRPFAHATIADATPFATAIAEAELLGVLAWGGCSSFGAALHTDDQAALTSHAARLLPRTVSTVRLGADLTAVVSGTPSTALAALLQEIADRESRSAASVWRFSNASLRRALDNGFTAADIEAKLQRVSTGPLPQPLSYLINDVARRHGNVRVSGATCVVHSDDVALIAELAVNRKLAKVGLRQLAPTVLVGRKSITVTLTALRAAGYSPVAEKADGVVQVDRGGNWLRDYDEYEPPAPKRWPQAADLRRVAEALLS